MKFLTSCIALLLTFHLSAQNADEAFQYSFFDVLGTARIAAIVAAKKTSDLIPLCHPLALDAVDVEFTFEPEGVRVVATASLTGKTGVEMEAMVAASTALLTIYDMAKALDKGMVIEGVKLLEKTGGKSGHWRSDHR